MKIKSLVVALALTTAPALAVAEGCAHGKQKQAMSCADGTAYDVGTHSCLPRRHVRDDREDDSHYVDAMVSQETALRSGSSAQEDAHLLD